VESLGGARLLGVYIHIHICIYIHTYIYIYIYIGGARLLGAYHRQVVSFYHRQVMRFYHRQVMSFWVHITDRRLESSLLWP